MIESQSDSKPRRPLQVGIRQLFVVVTIAGVVAAVATIVPWRGSFRPGNQAVFLVCGLVWAAAVAILGHVIRRGAVAGALVASLITADVISFAVLDGAPSQAVWLWFYAGFIGGCLGAAAAACWSRDLRVAAIPGCVGIAACAYNAIAWGEISHLLIPP